MANAGQLEARAALAEAIPKLASSFPPAPSLTGRTHFVHSSAHGATHWTFEAPEGETVRDYERLEHVGDALLGAEVTLMVHEAYPRLVVGIRSLVKSALVENEALALLSAAYGLPEQISATLAQTHSLRNNASVRACVFEAFLAAIYEEHGWATLSAFLRGVFAPLLPIAVEAMRVVYQQSQPQLDVGALPITLNPIGALNEWAQHGVKRSIHWGDSDGYGPPHCRTWSIKLVVKAGDDLYRQEGFGETLKKAKTTAATLVCHELGIPF